MREEALRDGVVAPPHELTGDPPLDDAGLRAAAVAEPFDEQPVDVRVIGHAPSVACHPDGGIGQTPGTQGDSGFGSRGGRPT